MFTAFMIRESRNGHPTTLITILAALTILMGGLLLHAFVGHLVPWASWGHQAVPIADALAMSWAICVPLAAILLEVVVILLYSTSSTVRQALSN